MLDVFYPPICVLCEGVSGGPYPHLCSRCLSGFEAVGTCCTRCGEPLPAPEPAHECLTCMTLPPPFAAARGLYLYRAAVAAAVPFFKYGRSGALDGVMCDLMAAGAAETGWPPHELVVPVPEAGAVGKRRKDVVWLLAAAVAARLGARMEGRALARRGRRRQVGLPKSAREANARGAYRPGPRVDAVNGRRVLLVDDVYTTGATVRACARLLGRNGASVSVLTLARATVENLPHLLVDPSV